MPAYSAQASLACHPSPSDLLGREVASQERAFPLQLLRGISLAEHTGPQVRSIAFIEEFTALRSQSTVGSFRTFGIERGSACLLAAVFFVATFLVAMSSPVELQNSE